MFLNREDLVGFIFETEVEFVDIRFCDLLGAMRHIAIPAAEIGEALSMTGVPFDGSSIRGFQGISESDMTLRPDISTSRLDPFRTRRTLMMNAFVHDPVTHTAYSRDPRNVAWKAEKYLATSGIADAIYFGAEPEFYIFDDVRFESTANGSFYSVDSESGPWNTGRVEKLGNLGYKGQPNSGYLQGSPSDHHEDLRNEMVSLLRAAGFWIERSHHEVGSAGQSEISYRYDTLLAAADDLMFFKYVVRNTANSAGKTVTFMPKPLFGENGSGLHCHQSLWAEGVPLFYDASGYGGLSTTARYYVGGLLHHAPSLLAFTNPTVNSYRRLVPGYEAPVHLVYSSRNRSACIRIPITGDRPASKRVEFRCPDPSCNPYLAFAAQLMAGLDGIRRKLEPPDPVDLDLFHLPAELAGTITHIPSSLEQALSNLESDSDYLLEGHVFTEDLIEAWIDLKRSDEIKPLSDRPHPYEFALYYDL